MNSIHDMGGMHGFGPIEVEEKDLAFEAIRDVGAGGHFLGCDHTQKNFKSAFWRSDILNYKPFETWQEEGEKD